MGFAFKRPKKRLVKADEAKREAFVVNYAVLRDEAERIGGKIFFADEVKRRCRTVLQSRVEALLSNYRPDSRRPTNAHPTLALV